MIRLINTWVMTSKKGNTYTDTKTPIKIEHNSEPMMTWLHILERTCLVWCRRTQISFSRKNWKWGEAVTLSFTSQSTTRIPALTIRNSIPSSRRYSRLGRFCTLGADVLSRHIYRWWAAIPIRITMSIAIGNISLILAKVTALTVSW